MLNKNKNLKGNSEVGDRSRNRKLAVPPSPHSWEDSNTTNLESVEEDCVLFCREILREGKASPREMSRVVLALEAWEEAEQCENEQRQV